MCRTLASIVFAVALAGPAWGEEATGRTEADPRPPVCAAYQTHARYLAERYGESPMFTGAVDDTVLLQVFVNRTTGTWTTLLVRTDGTSCVSGAGENGRPEAGI